MHYEILVMIFSIENFVGHQLWELSIVVSMTISLGSPVGGINGCGGL